MTLPYGDYFDTLKAQAKACAFLCNPPRSVI